MTHATPPNNDTFSQTLVMGVGRITGVTGTTNADFLGTNQIQWVNPQASGTNQWVYSTQITTTAPTGVAATLAPTWLGLGVGDSVSITQDGFGNGTLIGAAPSASVITLGLANSAQTGYPWDLTLTTTDVGVGYATFTAINFSISATAPGALTAQTSTGNPNFFDNTHKAVEFYAVADGWYALNAISPIGSPASFVLTLNGTNSQSAPSPGQISQYSVVQWLAYLSAGVNYLIINNALAGQSGFRLSSVAGATIIGGTGYSTGQTINLGTGTSSTRLTVSSVIGGVVQAVTIGGGGFYSTNTTTTLAQISTSGTGTGFQLTGLGTANFVAATISTSISASSSGKTDQTMLLVAAADTTLDVSWTGTRLSTANSVSGATYVLASGWLPAGGQATSMSVQYQVSGSGNWMTAGSGLPLAANAGYTVSGLTPGTNYDIRVRMVNSATSATWAAASFKTTGSSATYAVVSTNAG